MLESRLSVARVTNLLSRAVDFEITISMVEPDE